MKKVIFLSNLCAVILSANVIELQKIEVEERVNTKIVKDISKEELKSADLAEALMRNTPSVMILRRSAVSNDIAIRGMKKDNINVIIDGAKVYGGCSNRMDPPISHVLTNNIEKVIIQEGPFDVENFGTLAGLVDVKVKEPKEKLAFDINLNAGSFDYKKISTTISAGTNRVKLLLSMSQENSGQYQDGTGNSLYEQNHLMNSTKIGNMYQERYKNIDSYEKKTLLSTLYFNINDSQNIKFSYTANRSKNVLFANTSMDAKKIDTDIYSFNYELLDLGSFSKELNFNIYDSKVNHPMTSFFRNKSINKGETISDTNSKISGLKLKNSFMIKEGLFTAGLDGSRRTWIYDVYNNGKRVGGWDSKFTTVNKALFSKYNINYKNLNIDFGLRYDRTNLKHKQNNINKDINNISANTFFTYEQDINTSYFFGLGTASRVPDYKELVWGNNNFSLDKTKNYELDLGVEKIVGDFSIKTKVFYSILKDYIYRNQLNGGGYENLDAKVYGLEVSGLYLLNENIFLDYAISYTRGKKDELSVTQRDLDLADITPLRANFGLTYEYKQHKVNANLLLSDTWDKIDSFNNEQRVSSYSVLNLRYNNKINRVFDIDFGVDNLFNSTYAVSNTYSDISIQDGYSGEKTMINEAGRYIYANLRYKF